MNGRSTLGHDQESGNRQTRPAGYDDAFSDFGGGDGRGVVGTGSAGELPINRRFPDNPEAVCILPRDNRLGNEIPEWRASSARITFDLIRHAECQGKSYNIQRFSDDFEAIYLSSPKILQGNAEAGILADT